MEALTEQLHTSNLVLERFTTVLGGAGAAVRQQVQVSAVQCGEVRAGSRRARARGWHASPPVCYVGLTMRAHLPPSADQAAGDFWGGRGRGCQADHLLCAWPGGHHAARQVLALLPLYRVWRCCRNETTAHPYGFCGIERRHLQWPWHCCSEHEVPGVAEAEFAPLQMDVHLTLEGVLPPKVLAGCRLLRPWPVCLLVLLISAPRFEPAGF